jgi:hypothetical protein
MRSLVRLDNNGGSFSGTLIGGNGRGAAPGQESTFDFDVPAGKPALGVTVTFPDDAGTQLIGVLVDPDGQALATESNVVFDARATRPRPTRCRPTTSHRARGAGASWSGSTTRSAATRCRRPSAGG